MKSLSGLLLALVLLLSGGWLGRVSDRMRAEAGVPRPPPGPSSVLGGFSAVAIQILWIRADRALLANRLDECLHDFDLIHRLEPQLLDATAYFADEIGRNMADLQPDTDRRVALAMLGRRMYDRSVAANLSDHRAFVLRGRYTMTRIATDDAMKRHFFETTGTTPFEAAQNDFSDAYSLNPASIEAVDGFALSSYRRGLELLFLGIRRGDDEARAAAARAFRAAEAAYGELLTLQEARGFEPEDLGEERGMRAGSRRFAETAEAPAADFPALYAALREELGAPGHWPAPFESWPPGR